MSQFLRQAVEERASLQQQLAKSQEELLHWQERCIGWEEQNSMLTTLYVACQRLHSSLERAEALLALREIIANLVGCEEYALVELAANGLRVEDAWGLQSGGCLDRPLVAGRIREVIQRGEAFIASEGADPELTACLPLKREGAVTGVLVLFRLLSHKGELQELDRELFRLLESHLASVLYCTDLHESRRRAQGAAL